MLNFFSNFITLSCSFVLVGVPAVLNIFAYPVSKKLSLIISHYIRTECSRLLFAIFKTYKHFNFLGYKDNLDKLPKQFIVISNHQSLIDIALYMNFFRKVEIRFVAKDNLARHVPLVSEMLRTEEHCMIPRHGKPSVAMETIDKFGKRVIERGQVPVIFPEGTRSKDGTLNTFYTAGFRRLSDGVRLPVAVCALDGGYRINNLTTIFQNLHNGYYRVKVVGVFPAPQNKEEQVEVLEKGKELIQQQLDEWRKAE
ncbi:MAG: 1-acyl-sn-glycerol-3-phosphate acyltransferase [Treponema sp.]|nr:1-acyl-sn-glycerol-3-phosphate acyltransferase [Treponema sp.]